MYCRNCFHDLYDATDGKCPICGAKFDLADGSTYLNRPFPRWSRIILHILVTNVVGCIAAFSVALHQAARTSGH